MYGASWHRNRLLLPLCSRGQPAGCGVAGDNRACGYRCPGQVLCAALLLVVFVVLGLAWVPPRGCEQLPCSQRQPTACMYTVLVHRTFEITTSNIQPPPHTIPPHTAPHPKAQVGQHTPG